jgi:hypothetical protein
MAFSESIIARLGLDNSGFNRGLVGAQQGVSRFAAAAGKAFAAIGTSFVVGRVLGGLTRMADELKTAADTTGLTVKKLQELRYAAEQSGLKAQVAERAFEKFSRQIGEARAGQGALLPIVEELGIALTDSAGSARKAEDIFGDYADAIARTTNPSDRLRLATKAFGEEAGGRMVAMLKDGTAGLAAFADEARRAGRILDDDAIGALDRLDKRLKQMRTTTQTTLGRAVGQLGIWIETAAQFWGAIEGGATPEQALAIVDELEAALVTRLNHTGAVVDAENKNLDALRAQLDTMKALLDAKAKLRGQTREDVRLSREELRSTDAPGLQGQRARLAVAEALRTRALEESRFQGRINGLPGAEQARRELLAAARIESGLTALKRSDQPLLDTLIAEAASPKREAVVGAPSRSQAITEALAAGRVGKEAQELELIRQLQAQGIKILAGVERNTKAPPTIIVPGR